MFGELKSKIETYLTESYKKGTLKDNLFVFEELVLKNKNISKILIGIMHKRMYSLYKLILYRITRHHIISY